MPTVNANVTCLFTCNSAAVMPSTLNLAGTGQSLVVADGGVGGATAVGTLEKAAFGFVGTYADTKGDVVKSVNKAQQVIDKSKIDLDQGDKLALIRGPS